MQNNMNIRQLRYFICVAEEASFGRAAAKLHISQPPLSQQIKALEKDLQAELFVRGRHGARLTRAGQALLDRARALIADFEELSPMVQRVARGLEGTLYIGIINSVMYGPLPSALRTFSMENPAIEWSLEELLPHQQFEALLHHRIDVGFSRHMSGMPGLSCVRIYCEGLAVALPQGHPLGKAERLTLKELSDEPFVCMSTQSPVMDSIVQRCLQNQFQPHIIYESADPQTLLRLVQAQIGISILPQSVSGSAPEGVRLIPLCEEGLNADLYAAYRTDDMPPSLPAFIDIMAPSGIGRVQL